MVETADKLGLEDLVAEIVPQTLYLEGDYQSVNKGRPVEEYVSLVREECLSRVMADCDWMPMLNSTSWATRLESPTTWQASL